MFAMALMKPKRDRFCRACPWKRITFYRVPTNEPWCRDHGPIFLTREREPKLIVVDWDYNAWGNKYPPFDLDEVVPTRVAEILKLPVFYPRMILEGGSIDVNGAGALLTSESCLLNKNRNPNLSRDQIEQRLRDYLGVRDILWLGEGIAGDDTDGHIDDLARFVSERTVVTVVEDSRDDENYGPLQENLARLREMKIGGRSADILTLPMPKKIVREGLRLPASYANFYIANTCVLVPTFADPNDEACIIGPAQMFSGPARHRDRLPRTDLGTRHVSLPDAAATGSIARHSERSRGIPLCYLEVSPRVPSTPLRFARDDAPSISHWRRLIAALQNRVVQIGHMRFACIERDDYPFMLQIDFYVLHSGNVLQHRSQFAHALIAIFAFGRDLDRFQNGVIRAFRKKWIGRIGIGGSCRVHGVLPSLYLTCELVQWSPCAGVIGRARFRPQSGHGRFR